MKRIYFILVLNLLLTGLVKAQTAPVYTLPAQNNTSHPRAYDSRKSFWTEMNFQGNISKDKKWQYQIDYQYRRYADANYVTGGNTGNIFKDPYQQVLRPWIHYWVVPGMVRLSLSPIGYWATWTAPADRGYYSTDEKYHGNGKTFYPELRTCPQITLNNSFGRFQIVNRIRYEFRWIGSRVDSKGNAGDFFQGDSYEFFPGGANGSNHKGRMRWQLRMQVLLTSKKMEKNTVYLNTWNELFIGVGRHVGYNQNFDQNRMVALLGYKLPTELPLRVEAGITYQQIFNGGTAGKIPDGTATGPKNNVEANTAYTIYLIFDDFHTLFTKKKQPVVVPEEK